MLFSLLLLTIRSDCLLYRVEHALIPACLEPDLGEVEGVGDGRSDGRGDTWAQNTRPKAQWLGECERCEEGAAYREKKLGQRGHVDVPMSG